MYSGRGARATSASAGAPPPVEARITPRPPRRVCERPAAPRARALAPRLIAAGAASCARATAHCAAIVETDWGNLDPGCRGCSSTTSERARKCVGVRATARNEAISVSRAAAKTDPREASVEVSRSIRIRAGRLVRDASLESRLVVRRHEKIVLGPETHETVSPFAYVSSSSRLARSRGRHAEPDPLPPVPLAYVLRSPTPGKPPRHNVRTDETKYEEG